MSWDIRLDAQDQDGNVHCAGDWNHTHNCNSMIRDAGGEFWNMDDLDGMKACDLGDKLVPIIAALISSPTKYAAMNPDNGWGSYETLVPVLVEIRQACAQYPSATVSASF